MNIQTTRINTANALATGLIAIEDLEQKLNQIAQKVSKTIKMAGFRQGKVPVSIVKTRYKDSIEQDAQREMVQDMLNTALKDLKIDAKQLIGDPIITKFEKGEKNIDVEIKISILPEFDVSDALKSIPEPKIPTASPKQIQERLDMLARSQAPIVDSTSKVVKKGHIANIDFEGFVDNVAFEGGKAQGFDLDIGSNQFIPGFEDALVGAKVGEEKEIQVDFPQDYHSANLAGK
ncbi:trigger factor, partial [uncultured Helicobacter sp.]|uniref:trigger factor n=1 Tax=uncultured Helicobacter sp. TaxID=175537 RepID=UPI0025932378